MSDVVVAAPAVEAESSEEVNPFLAIIDAEGREGEVKPEVEVKVPEPKTEEKPKEDLLSRKFAALSRKEKQMREYENKLKQREAAVNEKSKQSEVAKEPEVNWEDLMRTDPLGAMKRAGYDLNAIAEIALNDGKQPIERQMKLMQENLEKKYKAEVDAIRAELAEDKKLKEENNLKQTTEGFKQEINTFVQANNEKYEMIATTQSEDLIYETIVEHYNTTKQDGDEGEILSVEDAADAVEQYLEEQARSVIQKTKKAKSFYQSEKPKTIESKPNMTLTNEGSAQSSGNSKGMLSDEESKLEAAKLISWFE